MRDEESNGVADDTSQPTGNPPIPPQAGRTSVDEEHNRQKSKRACYRRLHKIPIWVEAACAIALVIITWTYAYYAKKQWLTMNDTYRQIQIQTEKITRQTDLLHDQLVGTQSAVIRLGNEPGEAPLSADPVTGKIYFELVNRGRAIAQVATVAVKIRFLRIPDGKEVSNSTVEFSQTVHIVPLTEKPEDTVEVIHNMFAVPSKIQALFINAEVAAEVRGTLSYDNGFGEIKMRPICYFIFVRPNPPAEPTPNYRLCDNGTTFQTAARDYLRDLVRQQNTQQTH